MEERGQQKKPTLAAMLTKGELYLAKTTQQQQNALNPDREDLGQSLFHPSPCPPVNLTLVARKGKQVM